MGWLCPLSLRLSIVHPPLCVVCLFVGGCRQRSVEPWIGRVHRSYCHLSLRVVHPWVGVGKGAWSLDWLHLLFFLPLPCIRRSLLFGCGAVVGKEERSPGLAVSIVSAVVCRESPFLHCSIVCGWVLVRRCGASDRLCPSYLLFPSCICLSLSFNRSWVCISKGARGPGLAVSVPAIVRRVSTSLHHLIVCGWVSARERGALDRLCSSYLLLSFMCLPLYIV